MTLSGFGSRRTTATGSTSWRIGWRMRLLLKLPMARHDVALRFRLAASDLRVACSHKAEKVIGGPAGIAGLPISLDRALHHSPEWPDAWPVIYVTRVRPLIARG